MNVTIELKPSTNKKVIARKAIKNRGTDITTLPPRDGKVYVRTANGSIRHLPVTDAYHLAKNFSELVNK